MKKNLIGILLTLFCLTACYTTRVHINKNASPVPQMKYDGSALNFGSKHHNLVFGLIEFSDPVALHELCPDGVGLFWLWLGQCLQCVWPFAVC